MKKGILRFFAFGLMAAMLWQCTITEAGAYSATFNKTELHRDGECMTLSWSGFWDTTKILIYKGGVSWVSANNDALPASSQNICVDTGWEYRDDYKIRVERKADPSIFIWANNGEEFSVVGYKNQLIDFKINNLETTTIQREVNLEFNFTTGVEKPAPTQYMVSENSSFAGAIWQSYTSNAVAYILSADAGVKNVYFKVKNLWGESNWKTDSITYAPIYYFSIHGVVKNSDGQGVSGVVLSGFPADSEGTKTSLSDGSYLVTHIVSTWSGNITPSKSGYTFTPSSIPVSNLTSSLSNQNFTAISNVSYSWQSGAWSVCNDNCGGGEKTRTVECQRNDEQVVDDSYCTTTKPDAVSYDCPLGVSRLDNNLGTEQYVLPQP